MSTHNPDPWHAVSGGGRTGSLITIYDRNNVRVCSVSRQYVDNGTSCPPHDEYTRLGNADLIAAAPAMLKAISDHLSGKSPSMGLRFVLSEALGTHAADRACECWECFDYFDNPPL